MSNTEQDRPGTVEDARETGDSQVEADAATKEDELDGLDGLDDMEFMLNEIENRIAPLA